MTSERERLRHIQDGLPLRTPTAGSGYVVEDKERTLDTTWCSDG